MPIHLPVLRSFVPGSKPLTKEEAVTDCSYCRSPCCQFLVELKPDEIPRFAHEQYTFTDGIKTILKRDSDGYCVYHVRGHGCSTYEDKPQVCDTYSCRNDKRITNSLRYGSVKPLLR